MRIVSLIASATEIICRLGLRDDLVGRSHECDFPPGITSLPSLSQPRVDGSQPGATVDHNIRTLVREALSVYRIDVDALEDLRPDLIVTQDHCDVCAVSLRDVEDALCRIGPGSTAVCTLHPHTLGHVYADVQRVADAADVPDRGRRLVQEMRDRIEGVRARTTPLPDRPSVALIEWLEPPMIAGGWMPELARAAGAHPVIVEDESTFATVDWETIDIADPDVAIVLPCGYELPQSLGTLEQDGLGDAFASLSAARRGRGYVADGNAYFNRPGPRLADSTELLAGMIHPDEFPDFAARYRRAYVTWPAARER